MNSGRTIAGWPTPGVSIPHKVAQLAGANQLELVWQNEVGGLTYRLTEQTQNSDSVRYVKWLPSSVDIDLFDEVERLEWARTFVPVPRVISHGADPLGSWLVTEDLGGESAVSPRWVARPQEAVVAIGRGLRAFHDALPARDCTYSWSVTDRLGQAS